MTDETMSLFLEFAYRSEQEGRDPTLDGVLSPEDKARLTHLKVAGLVTTDDCEVMRTVIVSFTAAGVALARDHGHEVSG